MKKQSKKTSPIFTTSIEEFKGYVENSVSRIDVLRKLGLRPFGVNYERLGQRIREEEIDIGHFAGQSDHAVKVNRARRKPLNDLLVENSSYNKTRLKERILKDNILENKCSVCGMEPEWNGGSLRMILDHINGVHNDDRLDNLRLVCPNCNSQLPTHCGKNKTSFGSRCCDCDKQISAGKKRCRPCNDFFIRKVKDRPSKAILIKDVAETDYNATARKYGVCNATIRKWIKN